MQRLKKFQAISIAILIILSWFVFLLLFLGRDLAEFNFLQVLIIIWWQTFLYTGLFIIGHEAIHGLVYPEDRQINNFIGSIAVLLYAFFSYQELSTKHWLHHHHPATDLDPDFHNGKNSQFWSWYWHFLKNYWSWGRIGILLSILSLISYLLHISLVNIFVLMIFPSLLSSLQLFYFGTFLPHREPQQGYSQPHKAKSSNLPVFWSLITCYHFGYHQEHHENPQTPWWRLPELVNQKRSYFSSRENNQGSLSKDTHLKK